MRWRLGAAAGLLLLGLALTGCATPIGGASRVPDIQPGEAPASDTTEAGFWLMLKQVEEDLKTSGARNRDPALNAYVSDLVCRVAGEYCGDIRVYIFDSPFFNASMYPNGMIHVSSGLLLRCQNEAQLASVVGHEIGHYVKRHTVKRWKDLSAKANILQVLTIGLASVGAGSVAQIAGLAAQLSVLAYSRDQEREADGLGLQLIANAGYAPEEAADLWEYLVREQEAGDVDLPASFLSTHPAPEERMRTLRANALRLGEDGDGERNAERFLIETLPWRRKWLSEELGLRQFDQSQVVLDNLRATGTGLAELSFFQGELYRLRNDEGDQERAIAEYRRSIKLDPSFADSHRVLGLRLLKTGRGAEGRTHLRRYLELEPESEGRKMIEFYLKDGEKSR